MSAAFVFSVLAGALWGVLSAVRARTSIDYAATVVSLFGYSMPTFWLGLILILVFSLQLDWFPTMGMVTLGADRTGFAALLDVLHHLVLPTITLGTFYVATYARLTRASMLEVLGQEFITAAWAKGLPGRAVYYKHALRNALLPVITIVGLQIGFMFAGAVLTETIFAWPGWAASYQAILQRDYALLMGLFLIVSVGVILMNLVTDLIYTVVDPASATPWLGRPWDAVETFWTRYRKHRGAVAGLVVVVVLTAVALLAPAWRRDPSALGAMALSVPSPSHPWARTTWGETS